MIIESKIMLQRKAMTDKSDIRQFDNPIINSLMTIYDFIALFRPLLLIAVWMPAILGFLSSRIPAEEALDAVAPGSREGMPLLFLTVALLGASVFIINQLFDIEVDKKGKKHLPIAEGLLSKRFGWAVYIIVSVMALFFAFTWNLPVGLLTLLGIILGIVYSAPPMSFKDKPLGGLLLNAIGHGSLIFVIGYFWSNRIDVIALWESVPYAFAYGSVYIFTAIPDMEADARFGKKTLAVALGKFKSGMVALVLLLLAIGSGFYLHQSAIALTGIISMPFFVWAIIKKKGHNSFNKLTVFLLMIFTSLYYPWFFFVSVLMIVLVYTYNKLRYNIGYP